MTKKEETRFTDYAPLMTLLGVSVLAGAAISYGRGPSFLEGMHYFMGILLCHFASLKLFDLQGFVKGFQKYDIVAMQSRFYGYLYPFIELFLGLGYLSFTFPTAVYLLTVLVMAVGTVGVVQALRRGLNIHCPCMGSILKVPLSTVTLAEDVGMGLMALAMLML